MFFNAFGSSITTHMQPTEAAVEATRAIAAKAKDNNFFILYLLYSFLYKNTNCIFNIFYNCYKELLKSNIL